MQKLLFKLTTGVFIIKVKCAAFTRADPMSTKETVKLSVFLQFWGSAHIKAACKHVGEIDPSHFINQLKNNYFKLIPRLYFFS